MKTVTSLVFVLLLVACGGKKDQAGMADDSGMAGADSGMMNDSAHGGGMMGDSSGMGAMGDSSGMGGMTPRDTSGMRHR